MESSTKINRDETYFNALIVLRATLSFAVRETFQLAKTASLILMKKSLNIEQIQQPHKWDIRRH